MHTDVLIQPPPTNTHIHKHPLTTTHQHAHLHFVHTNPPPPDTHTSTHTHTHTPLLPCAVLMTVEVLTLCVAAEGGPLIMGINYKSLQGTVVLPPVYCSLLSLTHTHAHTHACSQEASLCFRKPSLQGEALEAGCPYPLVHFKWDNKCTLSCLSVSVSVKSSNWNDI